VKIKKIRKSEDQKEKTMEYRLKPGVESFEVVDGPMAGRKFLRGQSYSEIPPGEKEKFEKVQSSKVQGSKAEKTKTVNREPGTVNPEPEVKP
jgi:hypothetical protein